jgi:hypothetical protein
MKNHLWAIVKFLVLLFCLPVTFGSLAIVVWDFKVGVTVATFILCGLIDLLIVKKWMKK